MAQKKTQQRTLNAGSKQSLQKKIKHRVPEQMQLCKPKTLVNLRKNQPVTDLLTSDSLKIIIIMSMKIICEKGTAKVDLEMLQSKKQTVQLKSTRFKRGLLTEASENKLLRK